MLFPRPQTVIRALALQASLSVAANALTILPWGDSITYGYGDPQFNSYRLDLLTSLQAQGQTPTFIGAVHSGNFTNNNNEGIPGATIDQISADGTDPSNPSAIRALPDIVLLHAGTNDIAQNIDLANAPVRLTNLLNNAMAISPKSIYIVAQIIPYYNASAYTPYITAYNKGVRQVVRSFRRQGKKVYTVDMYHRLSGTAGSGDFADTVHPTPQGYVKMAQGWQAALNRVALRGLLGDGHKKDV